MNLLNSLPISESLSMGTACRLIDCCCQIGASLYEASRFKLMPLIEGLSG